MFFKALRLTINEAKQNDPSAPSKLTILLSYPGIHALMYYRVAHFLYKHHFKGTGRILSNIGRRRTGIDIHPGAKIGKGVFIDHGMGVVIGQTAVIGDYCILFHNVTLGSNSTNTKGDRHPKLGNHVTVYANSTIVGNIHIGEYSIIGANTFVKEDLKPHSVVVGNPMRLLSVKGEKVMDPKQECECMKKEIADLKEKLEYLSSHLN